jgi:hypothetical protein
MQAVFDILINNVRSIVMIVGMLLLVVGVVAMFFASKTAAVMLLIIGAGLVATPILKQFQAGGEFGVNLVTSFNETNEKLAAATESNTKAIEELRTGLDATRKLIADIKTENTQNPNGRLVIPLDKFQNFNTTTTNTLKKFDLNLNNTKVINDSISKQLQIQKSIINEMK